MALLGKTAAVTQGTYSRSSGGLNCVRRFFQLEVVLGAQLPGVQGPVSFADRAETLVAQRVATFRTGRLRRGRGTRRARSPGKTSGLGGRWFFFCQT